VVYTSCKFPWKKKMSGWLCACVQNVCVSVLMTPDLTVVCFDVPKRHYLFSPVCLCLSNAIRKKPTTLSIHLFSTTYQESGGGGSSSSRGFHTSLSLATSTSSDWGIPRRSQHGDIIPPPGPGSAPWCPPNWTCLEHLPREAPRWHPHCPNHLLAPF